MQHGARAMGVRPRGSYPESLAVALVAARKKWRTERMSVRQIFSRETRSERNLASEVPETLGQAHPELAAVIAAHDADKAGLLEPADVIDFVGDVLAVN